MSLVRATPSGSWRVKVYAGTDPLTGREIRLRRTCKTERAAQIELGKLLAMAQAGRQPDSDVTVAQLLDQYVSTAGWEPAGHGPDRDVQDLLGHRQDLLDPPMAAAATDTRPRPCSPRPGRWRFRCCGTGIPERTWPARQGRRDINALAAGGRHAGCGR